MKKLIVAIAIIAGTLGVNASVVSWQYKISGATGPNTYDAYTAYLVDATAWDAATISASTFTDGGVVLDSAAFNEGVKGKSNYTYTTLDTSGGVTYRTATVSGTGNLSVYYVILNTADNTYTTVADTIAIKDATDTPAIGTHTTITAANLAAATWTPVSVPEPTSGLLVVLGLAGMALKRKRA